MNHVNEIIIGVLFTWGAIATIAAVEYRRKWMDEKEHFKQIWKGNKPQTIERGKEGLAGQK